jgi:hypothetical protein
MGYAIPSLKAPPRLIKVDRYREEESYLNAVTVVYANVFCDKEYHVEGSRLQRFAWFRANFCIHLDEARRRANFDSCRGPPAPVAAGKRGVTRSRPQIHDRPCDVCFSNRPFRVKRFQTVRRCSVDVAHGLVLLFGYPLGSVNPQMG